MKKILLNAGHGGKDPGAVYFNKTEKEYNLSVVYGILSEQQFTFNSHMFFATRKTDVFHSLSNIVKVTSDINPDFFLSIHHNAVAGRGGCLYIHRQAMGKTEFKAIRLSDELDYLYKSHNLKWHGIKRRNFRVLTTPGIPCFLLEIICMDQEKDIEIYTSSIFKYQLQNILYRWLTNA